MKVKSKYLVLLLLLLVVCGGMVTYALFRTNKSGNATVNAARWNVVFKNGESEIENNFNIQLSNATWTNPLGSVASGKIAPGSEATFYITIDATNTETSVDYTAEIDESFDESDFEVTLADDSGTIPYSTVENAMIRQIPIRVVWNGNINDSETKNSDDLLKRARDITIPIKVTAAQKLALKYTVTFNDGAGNIISSKKVDEGSPIGTLPENPTRIGYTFAGWYDDPTNGNQVTIESLVNSGMNIYAHWNIKYVTVTFDSDGGSAVSSQQVQEGGTLSTIPSSTKSGYEFTGWYDNNNLLLTTSTQIMGNKTYKAGWNAPWLGRLVYYDPVSTNTCNASTYTGKNTCYRWRIIDTEIDNNPSKSNVTIQLNHELLTSVDWNTTLNIPDGPSTLLSSLATATSSWSRVPGLTYEYDTTDFTQNYGTLSCTNGTCRISSTGAEITNVKARIITGDEVAEITGINWSLKNNGGNYTFSNNLWIYSNSKSTYGYWTLSPTVPSRVYYVYNGNGLYTTYTTVGGVGARPVITVPKADLN